MSNQPEKPSHISQNEWDEATIPSWEEADFARAKPFRDAFPEQFAAWAHTAGRLKLDTTKVPTGFRLASEVVNGIKATGKGYNARVEKVLREALEAGKLDRSADLENVDAPGKL